MQASFSVADGRAVIRLQGRFDFNAHREFREATEQALREAGAKELRVDLAEVEYLDSSALGMLLMLRDKAKATNRAVVLANCRGAVRQVLDIANFGKLFTIV
ncbi:MAG TPA: STAS domain-containing protein [Rhodocyclaceae bacterium]|nr:STAS domain-containing protein [Rhodocyclaceae bacterium]